MIGRSINVGLPQVLMLGLSFFFLGSSTMQLELSFSALLVVALIGIEVKGLICT